MLNINVFFEDEEKADIIKVPDNIDIEKLQLEFLNWLFNKNSNHKYWVLLNGEKKYCSYGTSAFVEWLNDTVFSENLDKAVIIGCNSDTYCREDKKLFF